MVPETIEASLQLGSILLTAVGSSRDDIDALMDDFRADHYEKLLQVIEGSKES